MSSSDSFPSRRGFLAATTSLAAVAAVPRRATGEPDLAAYIQHDALGLAGRVAKGETTPRELLDAALTALGRVDPEINAISQRLDGHAEQQISAGLAPGPFRGVPFALKDLAALLKGTATRQGSRFFSDFVAPIDDTLVSRLKQAGLVIFAKTATPELGGTVETQSQLTGITRNPWNPERTAGGSSGGAAAAVAAGILPMAHATDSGGSIRIPASCCGVFGLKPTRARTPAGPILGQSGIGLRASHAVTRTVRDSAALLDATRGAETGARIQLPPPTRPYREEVEREPRRLRIGVLQDSPFGVAVHDTCREAVEDAAALCAGLGHSLDEVSLPIDAEAVIGAALDAVAAGVASAVDRHAQAKGRPPGDDALEPVTWALYRRGKALNATRYTEALSIVDRTSYAVGRAMAGYDAVLSATLTKPPIRHGEASLQMAFESWLDAFLAFDGFCPLYNVTGQPAMSVPLYWSADGLPIGVMFAASYGREDVLFRLAGQLERTRPWRARRPPIHV